MGVNVRPPLAQRKRPPEFRGVRSVRFDPVFFFAVVQVRSRSSASSFGGGLGSNPFECFDTAFLRTLFS